MRYSAPVVPILMALLVACSDGGQEPVQPPPPISLSRTIGAGGGTLASTDGRVSLTIPAGALDQDVAIMINEVANASAPAVPGATYELGPTGTSFAIPATLAIRYDQARLPTGADEAQLVLAKRRAAQEWELEKSTVDAGANRLSGEIRTFSTHGGVVTIIIAPPDIEAEYQPDRTIDLTARGEVPGEIIIETAKATGFNPPPDAAFTQFGSFHSLNTVVTYHLDSTAGVYWFRARYRWVDNNNIGWLGLYTDPPARVIVFGLPDVPDRATTFTAVPVDPGAIDLNFTFPNPGSNNIPIGYRIRRSKPGTPADGVFDLPLSQALPYRDAGLGPDTDYSYSLSAFNEAGEGQAFVVSAHTPPLPATACRAYTVVLAAPRSAANRGASVATDVTITRLGGFAGAITLALTGTGTQAIENIQLTNPGAGSTGRIEFRVKNDAPLGPASFTLEANSGTEFCPISFQVDIQQPTTPVVGKLTARPGVVSLTPGTSMAVWLGNSGGAMLHLASSAPTGVGLTVSFVPGNLGSGVGVAIISASAQIVPGIYTLTITGTGSGETRTVAIEVSLAAISSFSISMPSPLFWSHDQSVSHNGTLNRGPGFPNPVTMSLPDVPAGVSHAFNPQVITADPPLPINLGIHVYPLAAPGLHIMNVTGTAGSTVRTARILAVITGQTTFPAS